MLGLVFNQTEPESQEAAHLHRSISSNYIKIQRDLTQICNTTEPSNNITFGTLSQFHFSKPITFFEKLKDKTM